MSVSALPNENDEDPENETVPFWRVKALASKLTNNVRTTMWAMINFFDIKFPLEVKIALNIKTRLLVIKGLKIKNRATSCIKKIKRRGESIIFSYD